MSRECPGDTWHCGTFLGHPGRLGRFMWEFTFKGQNVHGTDGTDDGTDGTCPGDRRDTNLGGHFGPGKKIFSSLPPPQILQFPADTLPANRPPSLETPPPPGIFIKPPPLPAPRTSPSPPPGRKKLEYPKRPPRTRGCPAKILYVYWFFLSRAKGETPKRRNRLPETAPAEMTTSRFGEGAPCRTSS